METGFKKSLIGYLLNRRDYVRGSELSHALKVSTKTITRAVQQINEQYRPVTIIESKRGRGYRLKNPETLSFGDSGFVIGQATVDVSRLTSIERRDEIVKRLLFTAPQRYRVTELWGKYFIGDSAVATDLRSLRLILSRFQLSIEHVSGFVWIDGEEADIRRAIGSLFVDEGQPGNRRFMQPDQDIEQRDAAFVDKQLDLIEELLHTEIPYPYRVNIFTHLYILIERFRSVGALMEDRAGEQQAANADEGSKVMSVCRAVIADVNMYLDAQLPDAEVYDLYQYLASSRIEDDLPAANDMPGPVRRATRYLIDQVALNPRYAQIDQSELFARLSKHMKPLLNRLKNGIRVNNNLLEQIRLEYPNLFSTVKEATRQLEEHEHLPIIDDEEIGFITVYFAQAVENLSRPLNILLVCTTGLGTAQLLKSKIERRFSDMDVIGTVAARDVEKALERYPMTDLVVSTVALSEEMKRPTLVVSAMLTIEDQERLERMADHIHNGEVGR